MKIILNHTSMDFKKGSFTELERDTVTAELKRLEEAGLIGLTESSIKLTVHTTKSKLYQILVRFSRDFDIELV